MRIKKIRNLIVISIFICFMAGIGAFMYDALKSYRINKGFTSIPLKFNTDDSSSSYKINSGEIIVYGGFIKGIQKDKKGTENLVIRALSPLPAIMVSGSSSGSVLLFHEQISCGYSIPVPYSQLYGIHKRRSKISDYRWSRSRAFN